MKRIFCLIISLLVLNGFIANSVTIGANNQSDSLFYLANEYAQNGILYNNSNDFEKAEHSFLQSIDMWSRIKEYSEYKALPLMQLASFYHKKGENNKSQQYYNLAERVLLDSSEEYRYLLGALYSQIGYFYSRNGDYTKAKDYYEQGINVLKPFKNDYLTYYADAVYGKAEAFFFLKDYSSAIKICDNYLKLNVIYTDKFLKLKGNCLINLQEYSSAITILKKVVALQDKNSHQFSQSLLILAKAYLGNKDLNNAEKVFIQVWPILQSIKSSNDPWIVYYHEIYGQLLMAKAEKDSCEYHKLANYTEAVEIFDKALQLNTLSDNHQIPYLDGFGEFVTPTQVKDVFVNRTKALKRIGDIYLQKEDLISARIFYDRSLKNSAATINFLHDLRISFLDEESKLSLSEHYDEVYTEGFETAEYLFTQTKLEYYFETMLQFSESNKSATFLASLNDVKAKDFGGIPDSLLQKDKDLKMQLASLKQLVYNEKNKQKPDSGMLSGWNESVFNLQKKHDELIYLFERDYPDFYDFKYKNSTIAKEVIVNKLKSKQTLVEFYVDEPSHKTDTGYVYAMIFSPSGWSFSKQEITYDYVENIRTMIAELTNSNIGDTKLQNYNAYTLSSNYLYEKLIAPLNIPKKTTELIIIPDGLLSYVPFDALIKTKAQNKVIDFRTLDYLVYHYSISYSYSATLYFDYFKNKRNRGNHILAFAPEYHNTEIDLNKTAYRARQAQRSTLRPLPGARDEVMGLSQFQKSEVHLGDDASETLFKKIAANYDILHLAMHTIINDSIPMFSKLVFTQPSDTIDDGYLNTQEIYNLKLDARLTVLSACNTGTGVMRAGEGVMSLSRAFLYAGCPSIVMTLWEVEDKVSANLMLNFYNYLFKGHTKSEALQKAKLDHIKKSDPLKSHPYFWLGYIVVGDTSPLKFNNNVLISILVFFFIIIALWHLIRRFFKKIKAQ